jgi:hypothetical protein
MRGEGGDGVKLDPRSVKLLSPFWPAVVRRPLRFSGKRNSVNLQETALVVEGELLRFYLLGIERFVAGAISEWTTVTIPYSRILRVKCSRWSFPVGLFLAIGLALVGWVEYEALSAAAKTPDATTWAVAAAPLLAVGGFGFLTWRLIRPVHTVVFRSKDGVRVLFQFRIGSREARRGFDATLARYQAAAAAHAPPLREGR